MNVLVLIVFPLIWLTILTIAFLLTGGKFKKINFKLLFLYVAFMAMLGPIGEIFVGTFYEAFVGQPLWQYQILPTHNTYTSLYAPVIWGISGVLLYYIHEELRIFRHASK